MKIRKGFVSNSSSTSFCIVTTPEVFIRAYKRADTEARFLVKQGDLFQKEEFLGNKIVICNVELGSEYSPRVNWDSFEDIYGEPFSHNREDYIMEDFIKILKEESEENNLITLTEAQ